MKDALCKLASAAAAAILIALLAATTSLAQGTGFVYQGRLTDSNLPVNTTYDFQFNLFDALTGGAQVGPTNAPTNVAVSNGVFSVTLDFGATAFSGAGRWLEISARPSSGGAFILLTPRLPITPTPYAIKSLTANAADGLSASCTGCVTGAQIGSLPTGNGNYIQNTTAQQSANFNISGNGLVGGNVGVGIAPATKLDAAGTIRSTAQTVPSSGEGLEVIYDGVQGYLTSFDRSRRLYKALNLDGSELSLNAFSNGRVGIGTSAPQQNLSVNGGLNIDQANTHNGLITGNLLTFGSGSGEGIASKRTAGGNQYGLDFFAGNLIRMSITNGGNVGIGTTAPDRKLQVLDSSSNLQFGSENGVAVMRLRNSAPGIGTTNLILNNNERDWHLRVDGGGSLAGKYSIYDNTASAYRLTVDGAGKVGIGTTTPATRLDAAGTIRSTSQTIPSSGEGLEVIYDSGQGYLTSYDRSGGRYKPLNLAGSIITLNDTNIGNVGIGTTAPTDKLQVLGDVRIGTNNSLSCIKNFYGSFVAGTCSSDLRFKRQITPFPSLLDKVARLQPVHFYWRAEEFPTRHFGAEQSFGLIAQQVEEVLPELVTKDEEGYRAVNYSKLPLLILQAIKELKTEQDTLKTWNTTLQDQNAALQSRLTRLEEMMRRLPEKAEQPAAKPQ